MEGKYKPRVSNSKWFNTSIELLMEKEFIKNKLNYKKQLHIKDIGMVDFFLLDFNIIIECDGDFWHGTREAKLKDINRDFCSTFLHGYKTIRFWEHEINKSPEKCMNKILSMIKV